MVETEQARGRPHDAKAAQAAILDAAEAAFAENGFAGARVDAIAAEAGYNKSLIFHYFGDKLGLYEAVLHQADELSNRIQEEALGPLFLDPSIAGDARRFRAILETAIGMIFDYFVAQPRLRRIFAWAQAEDWQIMKTIWPRFQTGSKHTMAAAIALLRQAQRNGVLRPDLSPTLFISFLRGSCLTYLSSLPLLEMMTGQELSTPAALAQAREGIISFFINGAMADPGINQLVDK